MNKKGQTNGLITGLVFGVASLVIAVIIAFVIVSTLNNADLLSGTRASTTVNNESQHTHHEVIFINKSVYTLKNWTSSTVTKSISMTSVLASGNQSVNGSQVEFGNLPDGYNRTIPLSNFTFNSNNGTVISEIGGGNYSNVSITYAYEEQSDEERASDNMRVNFSEGVDRVSEKVPTVLLVAAVVLIIGILALLVGVWKRMQMGGGGL